MSQPPSPLTIVDETIIGDGYVVTNQQSMDLSNNVTTETTFTTTDVTSDIQVFQDLSSNVTAYYNDVSNNSIIAEIQDYASKITCSDFHGKGTISDYNELFNAAAKIANESKHMQLDVDIEGFNEFADAAEQLSNLFNSFIVKLENVNIIDDSQFLLSVSLALKKIWKLSETFGKFKQTILATSSIEIPKSAHDAKIAIENVVGQVNCAMKYISYFVDASSVVKPVEAELSEQEKNIIEHAVTTIDNWNILCDQGVSIAMSNNTDIVYITQANTTFKQNSNQLKILTSSLKNKLNAFGL